ncbi:MULTISPECIES: hypothetical protein [unclassified Ereboglobus]|uniref:hypothetical protein n=1 Tax=unclassified Ereboglobus TaxID=2626932 RepID=UPI0024052888|nr:MULTISPECIES: hypothetical protein [unclassified Ereboglobus]
MKATSRASKPSKGTLVVQKYRAQMNTLTDAERLDLLNEGLAMIYSKPSHAPKAQSRRR